MHYRRQLDWSVERQRKEKNSKDIETEIRLRQNWDLVKLGHLSSFYKYALQTNILMCILRQNHGTFESRQLLQVLKPVWETTF